MKNNAIKVLANKEELKDKKLYNELLDVYGKIAGVRQVYHYQLGYTPQKLENLKYEVKKQLGITEKEIALYKPGQEEEENPNVVAPALTAEQIKAAQEAHDADVAARQVQVPNPILTELASNPDAQEGLKIRDEYPFLNDPKTPDVFKILVADKITAYKEYAAKHAEALEAADAGEAEDKLYELTSQAVKEYQLNQDIKAELDFYRDSPGKVLGKHPQLADLKLEQEVKEMSEADLIQHRGNAQKSVNRYKDDKTKAHLHDYHSKKFELITDRLKTDFNKTFEK